MIASALVSAFRRKPKVDATQSDIDYLAAGRAVNDAELGTGEEALLFRMLHEEEGFENIFDIPYALKHLKDVHAVMRLAVAEIGDQHENLTENPLFHPAFGAFALGFCLGLVAAHRAKHMDWQGAGTLNHIQREQCDAWGVEITTYYLAVVDAYGIFGKNSDVDLYGISDKWWQLADHDRFEGIPAVRHCVDVGRKVAGQWSEDAIDVSAPFLEALQAVVESGATERFVE